MRKKRNTNSKVRDSAVLLVCLLGSFFSIFLFWKDLNRTFSKIGEAPVASITFRYRVAQRKFSDRLVWDRLRQNAPIYNGDVIRTSEMAEASLRFMDNTEIAIGENSIIQVFFDEKLGTSAVFGGGSIQIDSSVSGNGVELISGGSSVSVGSGSSVSASGERSGFPSEQVSGALASSAQAAGLQTSGQDGTSGRQGGIRGFFSSLLGTNTPAPITATTAAEAASASSAVAAGSAPAQASTLSVRVLDGSAFFASAAGEMVQIAEGQSVSANASGEMSRGSAVLSPRPDARFFARADSMGVDFSWGADLGDASGLVLEISPDKNFVHETQTFALDEYSDPQVTVDLPDGTFWWRIYRVPETAGGAISVENGNSGKFTVVRVRPLRTAYPAYDEEFGFRSKPPAVRFAWTEEPSAVSYILEIADNEAFSGNVERREIRNSSVVIPEMSEGEYYWRVTPVYQNVNGERTVAQPLEDLTSNISRFRVSRLRALPVPSLRLPTSGQFVNISAPVTFSWTQSPEALTYSLVIARDEGMTESRREFESSESFVKLSAAELGIGEGTWYWTVAQADADGTTSEYAVPQPFVALEGQLLFSTLFPPEQYQISEPFIFDIKFTWKNNIPGDMTFQVSRNSEFTDIVVNRTVAGDTTGISGLTLPLGTYYWRIVSAEIEGLGRSMIAPGKQFTVREILPVPAMITPAHQTLLRVVMDQDVPLSWENVPDAEYYQVKLFDPSGRILYENMFEEKTDILLNSSDMEDGVYFWSIQAQAMETPSATRMVGRTSEQNFRLAHVNPVDLLSPAKDAAIDGIEAALNQQYARWDTTDAVTASYFVLSREQSALPKYYVNRSAANARSVIVRAANPDRTVELPYLPPGTYWWTVLALTEGDVDISAVEPSSFRILPLPRLPAPVPILPAEGTLFNAETMQNVLLTEGDAGLASLFTFSWQPVTVADAYELNIYLDRNGERTAVVTEQFEGNSNTSFSVQDPSVLDDGNFVWTVEAKRHFPSGAVQPGELSGASFVIDLPDIPDFVPEDPGVLYGQ